jgi:YD repeat-containing protein
LAAKTWCAFFAPELIVTAERVLAEYGYTTQAEDGVEGRLEQVLYPEDGSGYRYSYSSIDGAGKLLERVEDLGGKLVEEHLWGRHPITGAFVVQSTANAGERLDLLYSAGRSGTSGTSERKTTVTRHIDEQRAETYEVVFNEQGRVIKTSGLCSSCGTEAAFDRAGNKYLRTDSAGRTYLSRFDALRNKLSEVQVSIEQDQPIAVSDEFDAPALDPLLWQALGSGPGSAVVEPSGGSLHLEIARGPGYGFDAGILSKFRLVGDFEVTLTYNGMNGAAQNNFFLFGVSSQQQEPFGRAAGYILAEQDENDGWRVRRKAMGSGSVGFGADEGNVLARRTVFRIVRSGNTFTLYRDGTNALGTVTQTMPSELYLLAYMYNQGSGFPALSLDVEDVQVVSGTARGDRIVEVPGPARRWEYENPRLPSTVTKLIEPSVFAGLEKVTVYDYDEPGSDPGVPNSAPTGKLHRLIEEGYSDENHDGVPEPVSRVTEYDYYSAGESEGLEGQLKTVDGPLEHDTVTYRYDGLGQLQSVTNSLNQMVKYLNYDSSGHASEVHDVNDVSTTLSYSRRGQLLRQSFDPGGLNLTTSNVYEDELLMRSTSPKGVVTLNTYDSYRRLESTARRASNSGADLERALYGYNFEGQRTQEQFQDGSGAVKFSSSTLYGKGPDPSDGQERDFVRVETPSGSGHLTTTWSDLSGRPMTRQDPSGHLTVYGYDSRGRLETVTEKSVSDGLGSFVDHVTSYRYDEAGNLTSVTDPQGLVTSYSYDDLGRLLKVVSPDSGETRYAYDVAGRLRQKTQGYGTAQQSTTSYGYDVLGRLFGVLYQSGGRNVDYYYDGDGDSGTTAITCNGYSVPVPQSYAEGRLSAVALILDETTSDKVVSTYEYDKRGLLLYERKYIGSAEPHLTSYRYDADGNIESIGYPRGLSVDYVYGGPDPDRVSAISADDGSGPRPIATAISYEPFGDVAALTYGNGLTLSLAHNAAYRLLGISVPGVLYRSFGRDSRGNIISVGYSPTTTDKTFAYDELSRLVAASGPFGSYSYRFDRNGNRLEVNEGSATTYQYYANTNRISGFNGGGATLTYNGLGNLIQNGSNLLTYGPDDRLEQWGPSGAPTATFLHMPDGRRLEKIPTAGPVVLYHHDQAGNLVTETHLTDPSADLDNVSVEYIYLGQHRLVLQPQMPVPSFPRKRESMSWQALGCRPSHPWMPAFEAVAKARHARERGHPGRLGWQLTPCKRKNSGFPLSRE